MATNTIGDSARQFPWQVEHYIMRGGPNDPVLPVTQALGTVPSSGGIFSWNSTLVLPPNPSTQTPPAVPSPRNMSINLTGANIGGILIGTIPQGAWIHAVEFFVYTAFTGGAGQAIGIGYTTVASDVTYGTTAFTGILGSINGTGAATGPAAGLFGGEKPVLAVVTGDSFTAITSQSYQYGPGNGTTGSGGQLASLGDINLYAFTSGAVTSPGASASAASATAFTAGSAAVRVSYTGLEG